MRNVSEESSWLVDTTRQLTRRVSALEFSQYETDAAHHDDDHDHPLQGLTPSLWMHTI